MPSSLPTNINQVIASDPFLGPMTANLLMCLCEAADNAPNPPAVCTFRIGNDAPHDLGIDDDFCCRGFAYVTILSSFPVADNFPTIDVQRQASSTACGPPSWAITMRAALVRCAPTGGDNGVTISNPAWEEAFLQSIYDTRTLQKASCCFRNYILGSSIFDGWGVVIDRITEGNAFGGCVERSVDITAQMPNCDCG